MEWIFCIVLGACSGFLGGMLGLGGGVVIVPALIYGLPLFGVIGPDLPKIAVATSLAIVMPTAFSSAQAHASRQAVDWPIWLKLTPGVVAGSLGGVAIAANVSGFAVVMTFVVFALYSAWKLAGLVPSTRGREPVPAPKGVGLTIKGLGIGVLSALVGIGGGVLSVPVMSAHLPMPRAVGTGAALGLPLAAAGVAAYLALPSPAECTAGCVGYVFVPAVGMTGLVAVLTAPLGARMAHAMPVMTLRRVFACVLVLVAANLSWKALPQGKWHVSTAFSLSCLPGEGTMSFASFRPAGPRDMSRIVTTGKRFLKDDRWWDANGPIPGAPAD